MRLQIPGLDGYLVDETGTVWSIKPGRWGRWTEPHRINPYTDKDGYLHVVLRPHGDKKRYTVHALVALAFIGERPNHATIAHMDGNKQNNRPENLAYVSQQENISQKWRHGTMVCGQQSHLSKIGDVAAEGIWQDIQGGATNSEIAERFGVCKAYASAMRQGRIRKHVTGIGLIH